MVVNINSKMEILISFSTQCLMWTKYIDFFIYTKGVKPFPVYTIFLKLILFKYDYASHVLNNCK